MSTTSPGGTGVAGEAKTREVFVGRGTFIIAAIGSAIGLGNIWRFPYVAYESGGGAFVIPYLVAILTAGIPILFFDYVMGHKYKSSPPLGFRMLNKRTEGLGWFQTAVASVIAIYYAAIVGWALSYIYFSFTEAWGNDAETFFMSDYLHQASDVSFGFDFVPATFWPLLIVWVGTLVVLLFGVDKGIGGASKIMIPILVVCFMILVVRALFLPGALEGLDALFTPDFAKLADPSVWIAAYGQVFFSLSVGFGIMITYASYLKRRTNLTGSGLVVAFANSSFEVLAGIGVFAALGFMANASGVPVNEVVSNGIGLAFIAFPTLISQMPGGAIFGVLFFVTLAFAGFTSVISIVQVPVAAIGDKFNMKPRTATIVVGGIMAIISILIMPTTTGLNILDVVDAFANNIGIVGGALVALIIVGWFLRKLPAFRDHLNAVSSFKVGPIWLAFLLVITPLVLGFMFLTEIWTKATTGYNELPAWFVGVFGWGMMGVLIVFAIVMAVLPWSKATLDRAAEQGEKADELVSAHKSGVADSGTTSPESSQGGEQA